MARAQATSGRSHLLVLMSATLLRTNRTEPVRCSAQMSKTLPTSQDAHKGLPEAARCGVWLGGERHYYRMPYEGRNIWGITAGIVRVIYERLYA